MSEKLRQLRHMAGISQFDLARMSGIGRTRISLVENGHISLPPIVYDALESLLLDAIRTRAVDLGKLSGVFHR